MSQVKFGRAASVIIGGTLYSGLHLKFEVVRTSKPDPNTCKIVISNLKRETRSQLRRGMDVILNAGYIDSVGVIFSGKIRTTYTERAEANLDTHITTGDGDAAYSKATVSVSLSKGAGLDQVLAQMAQSMGVDATDALQRVRQSDIPPEARSYPRGYAASGKASTELNKALARAGLTWSLQDGKLVVLKVDEVLPGEAILLRSARGGNTGLVKSPEPNDKQDQKGPPTTKIQCLMDPAIRPGVLLKVESDTVTGLFKAQTVKHSGDTHAQDWYTDIEAIAR